MVGDSEVFVAARPFTSFGGDLMQRLSPEAKARMVDAGICHFMMIVKEPSNKMTMFDFGPVGGDIAIRAARMQPCTQAASSTAALGTSPAQPPGSAQRKRKPRAVQGEVRVKQVPLCSQRGTGCMCPHVKCCRNSPRLQHSKHIRDCCPEHMYCFIVHAAPASLAS